MELKEIQNKEEWGNFLKTCAEKTFLQSWSWGEFNKLMGEQIWRFGVFSSGRLVAAALVLKISARRGTFLFIPHGPVIVEGLETRDKKEILQLILLELSGIAKEEKASFIRISPILERRPKGCPDNVNIFEELNFRLAPIHIHPEVTWELDITLPEEDLLMQMRKTTRYLIRRAEKNPDIQVIKSNNIDDLKFFWPVYLKTAKRHHFVVFSDKYLENEFKSFSEGPGAPSGSYPEITLFIGKYKDKVVSVAIFVFWQDICFYHHSGSLSKYNKMPVSYLLQWEAIKEAKKRGCNRYNFWGIAPGIKTESEVQKSKHPWAGLSLFKMGFGGYAKEYVKTQDYIISKKYWLNYIIEVLRKVKRGL